MKIFIQLHAEGVDVEVSEDLKLDATLLVYLAKVARTEDRLVDFHLTVVQEGQTDRKIEIVKESNKTLKELSINEGARLLLEYIDFIKDVPLSDNKMGNLWKSVEVKRKKRDQLREVITAKYVYDMYKNFHRFPEGQRKEHPALVAVENKHPRDFGAFYMVYKAQRKRRAVATDAEKVLHDKEAKRFKVLNENYEKAVEELPESFCKVEMLYIRAKLNGHPLNVFVDTGAQMSIISESAVARVGLTELIDPRIKISASGVGGRSEARGRICRCVLEVEGREVLISLAVLQDKATNVDLLLGLIADPKAIVISTVWSAQDEANWTTTDGNSTGANADNVLEDGTRTTVIKNKLTDVSIWDVSA